MGMRRAGKRKVKNLECGATKDKILSVVLTTAIIFLSSLIILNPSGTAPSAQGTPRDSETNSQPEVEYLAINAVIDNNYATTDIQEKFRNPYGYSTEETFQFEIPAKAFISNFSLTIDNETHYSQIVSSAVGREKYEEAVVKGTDAGLVEAMDKNIFSYSVSLSPRQEIIVGLRYEQFLEKSVGGYKYMIPLAGSDVGNDIEKFSIDITVRSKLFVNDLALESYRDQANVSFVSSHEAKVTYNGTSLTTIEDFIIKYELATPPVNGTMLNYNDGTSEFFFHIFSPQRSDLGGQAMAKEIIFVLDKSGSMSGKKIRQLKTAFDEIIDQLQTNDTFNLIMFDSTIKKYKSGLISASEKNKLDAVEYINGIQASGSTNINDALGTALDMFTISETKMPIIVMLTDGLPTAGVTNTKTIRENIRDKNIANVSLFCLGFGFDLDFEFLKAMSLENFGIAIRIYENGDASEQITDFYDTISTPLLRGLNFSYSAGAYEVYPTFVEQLFEGAEVVVVGKYNGSSRSITATVTAMSPFGLKTFSETFKLEGTDRISFVSQLESHDKDDLPSNRPIDTTNALSWEGMKTFEDPFKMKQTSNNSFIPRFWAYAKIRSLLDGLTVFGHNDSLVENVTDLALTYGFVTPYTSLLVEIVEPTQDGKTEDEWNNDNDNMPGDKGGYDGGEGESESESEAESEAEAEAESESESEAEWKVDNKPVKLKEPVNIEFRLEQPFTDRLKDHDEGTRPVKDTKNESEIEIEIETETEKSENIWVTVSLTNDNEHQCRVYWLGIHLDWQAKNNYYLCTDISSEDPKAIAIGETEYFYIYIEIPNNIQTGIHSYDILFQYESQDSWLGGWNEYYWQSKTKTDFKVNERYGDANGYSDSKDIDLDTHSEWKDSDSVISKPDDGTANFPEPLTPQISLKVPTVTGDDKNEAIQTYTNAGDAEDGEVMGNGLDIKEEYELEIAPSGHGESLTRDDKSTDLPFTLSLVLIIIIIIIRLSHCTGIECNRPIKRRRCK